MTVDKVPRGDVRAPLHFFEPPTDGSPPFQYTDAPPPGAPQRNYAYGTHDVMVRDVRGHEDAFTLDHDAFAVVQNVAESKADFADDESIRQTYYGEVEQLLTETIPDTRRVVVFDHTVRLPGTAREPVMRVHIDQTAKAAKMRVQKHAPEEVARTGTGGETKSRFRIVNVWRPLNKGPVQSFPLAFASSATVRDEDVVGIEHRYPASKGGYVGETAGVRYRGGDHKEDEQKWYYLSGMTGDERLLLECFDSEGLRADSGVQGGRLAHTAFAHPGTAPDAEGRASIEVRTLVFAR